MKHRAARPGVQRRVVVWTRKQHLEPVRNALGTVGAAVMVGVLRGVYAVALRVVLQPQTLLLVDTWQAPVPGYPLTQADLDAAYDGVRETFSGDRSVTVRRGPVLAAAANVADRSCDFVYLDVVKMADPANLRAWAPKVRRGGFVAGQGHEEVAARYFGSAFVHATWTTEKAIPPSFFFRVP